MDRLTALDRNDELRFGRHLLSVACGSFSRVAPLCKHYLAKFALGGYKIWDGTKRCRVRAACVLPGSFRGPKRGNHSC